MAGPQVGNGCRRNSTPPPHKATARLPQGVKVYYLNLIDQRNWS